MTCIPVSLLAYDLYPSMGIIDYHVIAEYVQPSFGDDEETCCMEVYVTLVESPASFYVQFTGVEFSVSCALYYYSSYLLVLFQDKFSALETALEQYVIDNKPGELIAMETQ